MFELKTVMAMQSREYLHTSYSIQGSSHVAWPVSSQGNDTYSKEYGQVDTRVRNMGYDQRVQKTWKLRSKNLTCRRHLFRAAAVVPEGAICERIAPDA